MKATSLKTAALLAGTIGLLAGNATAQATSGVVGYETLDYVSGFNFVGARLHETPVASGTLETVTPTTAVDADVDLGALMTGGRFILEIEDGSGIIQVVDSTDGGTGLTVADLTGVANGAAYTLRPSATLASIFGTANEAGLTSAADFSASDQVWLPDGAGDFNKYYFAAGAFGAAGEWKDDAGAPVAAGAVDIIYTDGVVINSQPAGGSVVVTGDLVTSDTLVAVADGFNFLGSVYPVGATLESTFGAANEAGLTSAADFSASDQIWVSDGAGDFNKYYFAAGAFGAAGAWKDDAGAPITASSIGVPSGYIINNTAGPQNVATTVPSFYAGL
ncbi:MAG: hypothetical protein O3A87_02615 [Verrucomicrobia bacterium]|nr:hypothetical protein [Verrucomicrobiota bacterium]MDA1005361.1 hypothetical protein [Verrucomicrobiota bacterium]